MILKQLYLYIAFMMAMVLGGYGEMSAASKSSIPYQSKDKLQKVDQKQDKHDAILEDASVVAYQACNSRPQRLLPTGNFHSGNNATSRLLFNRIRFLSSLLFNACGRELRTESAPIHFDVASKYYVICLRHLLC